MTTPNPARIAVLPETRAIAMLGCFDLIATVFLIATHRAQEGNGVADQILQHFGPAGFAAFKALLLGIPLLIAESARKSSPIFVPRALRVGLIAYLLLLLFAYKDPLIALIQGRPAPTAGPHHRGTADAGGSRYDRAERFTG